MTLKGQVVCGFSSFNDFILLVKTSFPPFRHLVILTWDC